MAKVYICLHTYHNHFQCNNPQTKEPKLKSAVRIVKEWPDYDNEIKRLQERVSENKSQSLNNEKPTGKYALHVSNS